MFVVAPSTVLNPAALETRGLPKRLLGRVAVLPRRGADGRLWLRLAVESQPLRYIVSLAPFVVAMLVWPHLALPIAQAPLAMVLLIGVVELKVFRLSDAARARLMSEAEAQRVLDLLRFKAMALLRDIAAGRDWTEGELWLVVEQSELARIAPLTLVSVQADRPAPHVLDLTAEERAALRDGLFTGGLTERALRDANLRTQEPLRSVVFDTRGVSAHARLRARLAARAATPAPA
ncbi:hypothetical protein DXV76_00370 [Rhodobacteraceae bacterium CCMM004]|nr:hypothetical protein DXV76_00370 [Rhodobacteraceae bacterium CCMM004]